MIILEHPTESQCSYNKKDIIYNGKWSEPRSISSSSSVIVRVSVVLKRTVGDSD